MPIRFPWSKTGDAGEDSPSMAEARRRIEAARREGATSLDLSNSYNSVDADKLSELPESLWKLTQLRVLDLSYNRLTALPAEISRLTALTSLDLSDNQLTALPAEIGKLTALSELTLTSNKLTMLPAEAGQLTALKVLNLGANQITILPPQIGHLRRLTSLVLYHNKLSSLPSQIAGLKKLEQLWLGNNPLGTLPPEVFEFAKLTFLDLSHTQLETLSGKIGQLTTLTNLDLSGNRLTALPTEIDRLTELKDLNLSSNPFPAMPREIIQFPALTGLNLGFCKLTTLPAEIGQLNALTKLVLYHNELKTLPKEIGRLTQLERLWITNNQLTTLPAEIGDLTALTYFSIYENQLTTLPAEIGNLTALRELDLHDNHLATLPVEIGHLTALEKLFLHENSDLGIPEEVLGPTRDDISYREAKPKPPKEILDYYFSTRGDEGVALCEMKLIVVGWGKAGKTTLVKRLAGEPMDPTEPETHGIMIRPLDLQCTDGGLKARVWDFGGQVILHSMHEFFLTARSLYLLVIEQRGDQAEKDAKYWLNLIRTYAPGAPVVIALNKSGGIERPIDRESLEQLYGPILAWVPTECLPEADCPGAEATIAALRTALTAAAEEPTMPEPRKRFPKKWVEIKDWLEGLDKDGTNFLDYETFSRECAMRGEPDAEKQAEVAALMHDLGVAMNYARDERLRDTTVLRPDWLANGIYAVLRANLFLPGQPLAPDAVLTPGKLGEIYKVAASKPVGMLKAQDYPAEKWEFLLRLMNLFQLSFPISEDGLRQLCPTLLRAEPPPGTDEPQSADTVRLRYEFAVVPAPLLPRFMVRTFSLIEQDKLWQRGAMLRYPGARARVWTTAEEKYLFATVAGSEGDRTELLSIIRGTLTELFGEYRDLKVTEQRWFDGQWVPRKTLERFGVLEPEWEDDAKEVLE